MSTWLIVVTATATAVGAGAGAVILGWLRPRSSSLGTQTIDELHGSTKPNGEPPAQTRIVFAKPSVEERGLRYRSEIGYLLTDEWIRALAQRRYDVTTLPITIYLSDESVHEQVETVVEDLLASVDGHIEHRDDPIFGSWFRRMRAEIGEAARSPLGREATLVAAHAAESRFVHAQDATVTATLMQNLGPVLAALQPTKDAVLRVGALLIVKVDGVVMVHQLTAAQQLKLDHQPQLAQSPHDILTALELRANNSAQAPESLDGATGITAPRSTGNDPGIPQEDVK